MEGSSKHPCLYCTVERQTLNSGLPRTIGSLKKDFEKWVNAGGIKNKCKEFNNVQNYPLFESLPLETPTLKITRPLLHFTLCSGYSTVYGKQWKIYLIIIRRFAMSLP